MAIYHLSVKAISRSTGRSATAAAAYRAGEEITDERTGQVHDYTRKGGVEHTEIVLPAGADWEPSRSELWNAAEAAEKRKDACVAREFEVALPAELSPAERRRLVADFARDLADREGCAVDIAIHAPGRGGDSRNHHAHILRTTRKAGAAGLGEKLDTEKAGRRRKDDLESVRARWAEFANRALERAGLDTRIDHRTLEAQGQDRAPGLHLGPALTGMARRGAAGEVGQRMAEAATARLFAAREVGRIERELAEACAVLEAERERPPGRERPGPAIQAARFRISGKESADSGQASPNPPLESNQTPPGRPLEAAQSHEKNNSLPSDGETQKRASERLVAAVRPWSAAAVAADLRQIDPNAPIEQQVQAFLEVANSLANWRLQKAGHASDRAQERYRRRYRQLGDAQEARRQATPSGLLGVFKQKAHAAADAAYQRASALHGQASALAGKLEAAAREETVKQWTWRRLAEASPDLTERVKAHRQAERLAQSRERQAAQKARERGRTGPRRGR